ncbi:RNA polymerase factor sigma-54 [Fibrobacter sp. UWP2]|jgi:RNA polymerase sigma-54 factor|uniref:RNA polymerase factor sigma-54 n=1 Tax=Fibrobacter sp. UWP2 TaxID=1896216 RepID=UPI000914ABBC|nr:RNA polymerase factor sigma-54 [Fibrobacter sp. UWP2]SHJ06267.1 RNA polymerase, sigma 54 subunit, RpoN/SigL [Fibrobacter sp. UWP2]
MDLGMQLGQSQRLEQTLSPQLLQSVTILQKTALELETAIKEEIETNPLLEIDEGLDEFETAPESGADDAGNDYAEDSNTERGEMDFERGTLEDSADTDYDILDNTSDADWVKRLEDGADNADAPFRDLNVRDPDEDFDLPQKDRDASLQDRLLEQLREWNGTHQLLQQLQEAGCTELHFRTLVQYLIDSLDENGFLQPADEVAMTKVLMDNDRYIVEIERVLRNEIPLESASLPVAEAIHVLQSFKPRGIGARNMQESFIIQAMAIDDFPEFALKVLREHFDDLMALRYAKIAKDMNASTEQVQQVVASLSRLSPHPGLQISNSPTQIKAADMRVVEKKGRYEVECFKSHGARHLRINKEYVSLLSDKGLSKKDREYIQNNLNKANDFIKAIDNRYSTMEKVMRAIVKRQKDFFKKGPAFLKPMILQEIADEVGRDLSTVSRVTNGKYVETPYGIYELKQFFTSGVKQDPSSSSGEVVGSAQILAAIKKLVDEEDKKKPLSDQALTDALESQGIKVARRTVAKYREEELKILPARLRKQV